MKALKVMYRGPEGPDGPGDPAAGFIYRQRRHDYNALYSAIPTPNALRYYEGEKTTPEVGKLMVFLNAQAERAQQFCSTAAGWYRRKYPAIYGTVEIWRAECHNLYRVDYLIPPRAVVYDGLDMALMVRFWTMVWAGRDPRVEVGPAKKAKYTLWTTDSVIPEECLAVYGILCRRWRQQLEAG